MSLVQKEPKSIYYGEMILSDMQGPCEDGFHIPLKDEWSNLHSILVTTFGLADTGVTMGNYLKMPYVGFRHQASGGISQQGQYGFYWTSSYRSASSGWSIIFTNSSYSSSSYGISFGMSIRPFKNEAIIPDSSWNVLYQGTGTAGIYHNSTQGLISISGDGTNRITISDKNLGATSVYNSGDTLNADNCGGFYQWGNNYMFPFTGPVTTSSTAVNASTYGPGNYYSSSTFITAAPRDNSSNDNLRGGTSQGTPKKPREVKAVYLGNTLVRPIMRYLCFTANTANSTVAIDKYGTPTAVSLETSPDGITWTDYTFQTSKTLTNVGDKIYFRNKSTTTTGFSPDTSNYYQFSMSGSIAASGDVTYLINKNGTDTITTNNCFFRLFNGCSVLTTPPELPATTLTYQCYRLMFYNCINLTKAPSLPATTLPSDGNCYYNMFTYCSNLEELPELPATTLSTYCYYSMFERCSKIKLSTTQTGAYQTPYRIPAVGTGTNASSALGYMFRNTGGTFTGTPTINTTYYTSNTVV